MYEAESELLRGLARQSVAAFVSPRSLSYDTNGQVSIHAPTLGEVYNLCDGESFADEPNLAFCSGVLVDDDLIATAGHCLGDSAEQAFESCRTLAVVFDYLYEAVGELAPLSADDVYRCRQVVAWSPASSPEADFGVIQLDRPVRPGLSPAPFAAAEVTLGQHVNVIGFGAGLPAKIDAGATATINTSFGEYFTAATDTFAGNSGSPVFSDAGQLIGLHVAGQSDWMEVGFCTAAVHTDEGDEIHQRGSSVLAGICGSGWPSARLCGTTAACGDGFCSADEYCPADCPLPSCGNGLCEGDEPYTCSTDCPSYVEVPAEWICPDEYYGDRLGCDCNCGAKDIDCDNPFQVVLNCSSSAFCNSQGECERPGSASASPDESDEGLEGAIIDGRPVSAGEPRPGDELIVDERALPSPAVMKKAESDGGCSIASRHPAATRLAPGLLLALYWRRRRALRWPRSWRAPQSAPR